MKNIEFYELNRYETCWVKRYRSMMFKKQRDLLLGLSTSKTELKRGDRVFFTNHVKFPRFKFREWAKGQGIEIAKKIKNSTVVIVDHEYIKDCIPNDKMKVKICKEWVSSYDLEIADNDLLEFRDENIYRRIDHPVNTHMPLISPIGGNFNIVDLWNTNTLYKKDTDALEQLTAISNFIQSEQNGIQFMDYKIFTEIIAPAIVIDLEMYEELDSMISNDEQSISDLGIEMLTNINIDKSRFYLDLLLYKFGHTIRKSVVWKRVTFKPMIAYINKYRLSDFDTYSNHSLEYFSSDDKFFKELVQDYHNGNASKTIDWDMIRNYYRNHIIKELKETSRSTIPDGISINEIYFNLDPEIFPGQISKYTHNEQKEQGSRPQLGEEMQEILAESLSEYCDQQE